MNKIIKYIYTKDGDQKCTRTFVVEIHVAESRLTNFTELTNFSNRFSRNLNSTVSKIQTYRQIFSTFKENEHDYCRNGTNSNTQFLIMWNQSILLFCRCWTRIEFIQNYHKLCEFLGKTTSQRSCRNRCFYCSSIVFIMASPKIIFMKTGRKEKKN